MNTLPNESTCPRCGKPVSLNAFEGLCPECLMQAGFGTVTGGPREKTSAFVPPTPVELAAHFPQLEILELLGHGGMGAVYKVRQTHLDRIVALKILPPGIGQSPSFAERFVREAKALAKLHHPNIVTLYESGQADGLFYFLMEFVDGMNLRQLLSAGTISPKDALAIVPQICDALQFAHDRGIVHRDIKPENILLSKTGQVKIADFGVAKLVAGELPESASFGVAPSEGGQTEVGKVIGTPHYMAPEQISHPLEVDNRADIYALGVVFYQMLTGELPVGKFGPPSGKVQIDVRLDEVVLRALEKQPELRYQHVSALKTQIETIVATRSAPGVPLPSQAAPDRADVLAPGTFSRKGRTLAIAGAILQPGSIIGLLAARLWPMQAFGALQDRGAANLSDVGETLGISLVGTAIAAIAFVTGLVFLCISLAVLRYRAKWFFRFLTIYSWPLLLLFPFGTAAGVFFLIYCLSHREKFIGVASPPPLSAQTRSRQPGSFLLAIGVIGGIFLLGAFGVVAFLRPVHNVPMLSPHKMENSPLSVTSATAYTGDIKAWMMSMGLVSPPGASSSPPSGYAPSHDVPVTFTIPEENVPAVVAKFDAKQPQAIEAYDRVMRKKIGEGFLVGVDNQIDASTGMLTCKGTIVNSGNTILFPNMFLNILLLMESKHGVTLVPVKAIEHGPNGTFVYLVKPDHTVAIRRVAPGIVAIEGDVMEIKEGLSPGETVVLDVPAGLREGSRVR